MEYIESNLIKVQNRYFSSNTYLLLDADKNCIIIDPGLDIERILAAISMEKLNPVAILATHGHFDHIGAAAPIKKQFGIPFYLHRLDLKLLKSANFYIKFIRLQKTIEVIQPDEFLESNPTDIKVAGFHLKSYNFPGHTNGSVVFKFNNFLFTGDLIFRNGLGFNGFPGENKGLLRQSIIQFKETFSESHLVLPGHRIQATLGEILRNNLELKIFLLDG